MRKDMRHGRILLAFILAFAMIVTFVIPMSAVAAGDVNPAETSAETGSPETESDAGNTVTVEEPGQNVVPEGGSTGTDPAAGGEMLRAPADRSAEIDSISVAVTPPAAGERSANASGDISVSGEGVSMTGAWWHEQKGYSTDSSSTIDFVESRTYYAVIHVKADEGSTFALGDYFSSGDIDGCDYSFGGTCAVTGGTLDTARMKYSDQSKIVIWITVTAGPGSGSSPTPIESVTINVTKPTVGAQASVASAKRYVSVPSDGHYSVTDAAWKDASGNAFTGSFEEGTTYRMEMTLAVDSGDYFFRQGGGSYANLAADVTGATLVGEPAVTNYSDPPYSTALITVSFTPSAAISETWIDNTVDNSRSYVTGAVYLTGNLGTSEGYNPGKTVYSNSAKVTFSNPKTETVQSYINAAYNTAYYLANECKEKGDRGEFHMSTSSNTGQVWDNRKYTTYVSQYDESGNVIFVNTYDPTDIYASMGIGADPGIRMHIASGDYGRYSLYLVQANGWVSKDYAITVTDDGNGTAVSDVTTSTDGKTITLTATPREGYEFKEWQVVSGGAVIADTASASTTFVMPANDVEIKAVFQKAHAHDLSKTDKAESTCTGDGTEAYWTCSVCGKMFSDAEGTKEIKSPVTIPATGHDWGDWTVTKEPTADEAGTEVRTCRNDPNHTESREIDIEKVIYTCVSGNGGIHEKGSDDTLTFTFKRSTDDAEAISHFTGIKVDGSAVDASNFTAVSGSVVVTLKADYLDTLAARQHKLSAVFDDGDAPDVFFTIAAKKAADAPATGDDNPLQVWIGTALICAVGILIAVMLRKRHARG